jgi:hypothetical protein
MAKAAARVDAREPTVDYTARMAQPARRGRQQQDAPPLDPFAIERAYRLERAKRRARTERKRASRRAGVRFLVALTLLLGLSVFLSLTIWQEIQRLFGL